MGKLTNNYDKEIKQFTDAMRYKLHVNRHKGKWEGKDLEELFKKLREEVDELEAEILTASPNQTAVLLEAADIGNVAMMISNVAMRIASGEILREEPVGIVVGGGGGGKYKPYKLEEFTHAQAPGLKAPMSEIADKLGLAQPKE